MFTRSMQAMMDTRKTGRMMCKSRFRLRRPRAKVSMMIPPKMLHDENKKIHPLKKGTDVLSAVPPRFPHGAGARRVQAYALPLTRKGRLGLLERFSLASRGGSSLQGRLPLFSTGAALCEDALRNYFFPSWNFNGVFSFLQDRVRRPPWTSNVWSPSGSVTL